MLSRGVAKGIGIAREYQEHRKEKNQAEAAQVEGSTSAPLPEAEDDHDAKADDEDEDEEAWAIDDAQEDEHTDIKPSIQKAKSVKELLAVFEELHPPPAHAIRTAHMPLPVILPQRRPRHRERGFVRAYAPILQEQGIDQAAFLDFLDGFEQAIRLHPAFHAANVAVCGAVTAIQIAAGPSLSVHAAAFVIHSSLEVSRRSLIFHETNRYLDGVNEIFFKPRGLYAMIMTYKPDSKTPIEEIKPSDSTVDAVNKRNEGSGGKFSRSSGKTHGEMAIPSPAPLVYPAFDAMSEEKKDSKMKDASNFLSDLEDRKARARYDAEAPDSKLQVSGTEFKSRYSDPHSPAVLGGLSGIVTGGRRPGLRYRLKQKHGKDPGPKQRGPQKLLKQDVYYLAIVNMPSDEELAQAKAAIEPEK